MNRIIEEGKIAQKEEEEDEPESRELIYNSSVHFISFDAENMKKKQSSGEKKRESNSRTMFVFNENIRT